MGVMSTVTRITASPVRHGGHALNTKDVMSSVSDSVNPTSAIQWRTNNPTVMKSPRTSTIQRADRAEREAGMYEIGVENGLRHMNADARRHEAHAKLVNGHRVYLGRVADSQVVITAANRALAGKLHGHREAYAAMGHGLDRKAETTDQRVELIAAKYGAI
jgi:hypothetical protein